MTKAEKEKVQLYKQIEKDMYAKLILEVPELRSRAAIVETMMHRILCDIHDQLGIDALHMAKQIIKDALQDGPYRIVEKIPFRANRLPSPQ